MYCTVHSETRFHQLSSIQDKYIRTYMFIISFKFISHSPSSLWYMDMN